MKIGRNDPCHCGSGKKYKKCCEATDEASRSAEIARQAAAAAKAAAESTAVTKESGPAQRPNAETASRPKFPAPPAPPPPIRRRAV